MYVKQITYTDFDGEERTERFYFNLTKAELLKMEINTAGGLRNKVERIVAAKDNQEIWNMFEQIVDLSFGKKSDDGRRFIKSPEILADFKDTNAYSEFIVSLFEEGNAADFINGLVEEAKHQNASSIPAPALVK